MSKQFTLAEAFRAARYPRNVQGIVAAAHALNRARVNLAAYDAAAVAMADASKAQQAARAALPKGARASDATRAADQAYKAASAASSAAWRACYPSRGVRFGSAPATLNKAFPIGGYSSAKGQFCEAPPFRFVGLASDLIRLDHTGWHTAPDGWNGESARGVVYQTAARDGRACYIPAIADPCNAAEDGSGPAILALGDMEQATDSSEYAAEVARRDAARRADQLAEYYAEAERDYQESYEAGQKAREKAAEVRAEGQAWVAAVRAVRARFKARHGLGLYGVDPDQVRGLVRAAVAEVRACCDSYKAARAEAFRLISESRPGRRQGNLAEAWAEGYSNGGGF